MSRYLAIVSAASFVVTVIFSVTYVRNLHSIEREKDNKIADFKRRLDIQTAQENGSDKIETISLVGPVIVSALTFLSSVIFGWRSDRRDASKLRIELEKAQLEIEKSRIELEKLRLASS